LSRLTDREADCLGTGLHRVHFLGFTNPRYEPGLPLKHHLDRHPPVQECLLAGRKTSQSLALKYQHAESAGGVPKNATARAAPAAKPTTSRVRMGISIPGLAILPPGGDRWRTYGARDLRPPLWLWCRGSVTDRGPFTAACAQNSATPRRSAGESPSAAKYCRSSAAIDLRRSAFCSDVSPSRCSIP
jgi:hypothetical protein